MNKSDNRFKCVTGGSIIAGLIGGFSAHAQYVVTDVGITVTTPTNLYFDVDDSSTSTSDTSLEFDLNTNESFPFSAKVSADNAITEGVSGPLNPGDTVSSGTTFSASQKLSNGTNDVGFYICEPFSLTPNYGYFEIVQSSTSSGDPLDPLAPSTVTYTDTLVKTVINPTKGMSVTVAPEPGTTSLLLAGAAGVAGLAAWRRRTAIPVSL